jgi:hypothetical protein
MGAVNREKVSGARKENRTWIAEATAGNRLKYEK